MGARPPHAGVGYGFKSLWKRVWRGGTSVDGFALDQGDGDHWVERSHHVSEEDARDHLERLAAKGVDRATLRIRRVERD